MWACGDRPLPGLAVPRPVQFSCKAWARVGPYRVAERPLKTERRFTTKTQRTQSWNEILLHFVFVSSVSLADVAEGEDGA
jgi:hypothetical protein